MQTLDVLLSKGVVTLICQHAHCLAWPEVNAEFLEKTNIYIAWGHFMSLRFEMRKIYNYRTLPLLPTTCNAIFDFHDRLVATLPKNY